MAKKPEPIPDHLKAKMLTLGKERPTSPSPPRKKVFPPVTLIGIEALAVGDIVDQLENTIRVLIGLYKDKSWQKVTRGEIEWYIALAEKQCENKDDTTTV